MILFISDFGGSLPIVYRMRQEGAQVEIYIHNSRYKNSYDGIIDKIEIRDLKKAITKAEKVIFDSDVDIGSLSEYLKDKVINDGHNLKNKIDIIAITGFQEKRDVSGVQLITEMWFDGKEPVLLTHSLPNQRWLTGDLGLKMGSQSNCMWLAKDAGVLSVEFNQLGHVLGREGYVGAVSVDYTVNSRDKKPYLNSWHLGFRYDSIFCLLSLMDKSITEFMTEGFSVKSKDISCSERITIAPYPYANEELLNGMAKDKRLNFDMNDMNGFWGQDIKDSNDGISCAGNDGILGVMTGVGKKTEEGFGKIYKSIRKLDIEAPLQFRIDGAKESNKKLKKLKDWNICIN